MTASQHPHADRLAAIARHLNTSTEATAPDQTAGDPYTSEEGGYIRRLFHSDQSGGVVFGYTIVAYEHTTDIFVDVQHSGIEADIMVPGDTPADEIAHAAMTALRTAINAINAAQ